VAGSARHKPPSAPCLPLHDKTSQSGSALSLFPFLSQCFWQDFVFWAANSPHKNAKMKIALQNVSKNNVSSNVNFNQLAKLRRVKWLAHKAFV
jgi:hypothetical protein